MCDSRSTSEGPGADPLLLHRQATLSRPPRPWRRDRVMGNPRFLRVLAVEWVLGCTAKTIAEVQARGSKIWEELDFLASDLSLEARLPRVHPAHELRQ